MTTSTAPQPKPSLPSVIWAELNSTSAGGDVKWSNPRVFSRIPLFSGCTRFIQKYASFTAGGTQTSARQIANIMGGYLGVSGNQVGNCIQADGHYRKQQIFVLLLPR